MCVVELDSFFLSQKTSKCENDGNEGHVNRKTKTKKKKTNNQISTTPKPSLDLSQVWKKGKREKERRKVIG